jgi:hypothetical protein
MLEEMICGWPVDEDVRAKLRRIQPLPVIVPGSVQTDCARCSQRVWIGPRQLQMLTSRPSLKVVCIVCIVTHVSADDIETLDLGNPDSKLES